MSVSKFESLPNEILTDLFENYMNGIDILNGFAFQLNRRFDALIIQSRKLNFNFIRCRKDDFRLCMGLLPVYINKIEELALAERYTPGQIHAFLSFYPSFHVFQRLQKLHLHIHTDTVGTTVLRNALRSLAITRLHTLSLDISGSQTSISLQFNIVRIFSLKTLKRLLISGDHWRMSWQELDNISSNIEYLTIHGSNCSLADLRIILCCTTSLRYLAIDVHFGRHHDRNQPTLSPTDILPPMSMLHTAILNLKGTDINTTKRLEPYFQCMIALRRLEIKIYNVPCNITVWATTIQTTLPLLSSFILQCKMCHLRDETVIDTLRLTETPFWKSTKQFHVIIKDLKSSHGGRFHSQDSNNFDRDEWFEVITRWCIGPQQCLEGNSSVLNRISNLHLSTHSYSFLHNHYLNNVVHLILTQLDHNLFKLLTSHINCQRIKFLDVSSIGDENNLLFPLLAFTPNIQSLRICSKLLCNQQMDHSKQFHNVQFLDLSSVEHTFNEEDISLISKIFPHVAYLIIHTKDLHNVPLLQNYLPQLRSLCYYEIGLHSTHFSVNERKAFDYAIRGRAKFLYEHRGKWNTIWIDTAALQESWWPLQNIIRTSITNTSHPTDIHADSPNTDDDTPDTDDDSSES